MPKDRQWTWISGVLLAGLVFLAGGCGPIFNSLAAQLTPAPPDALPLETPASTTTSSTENIDCVYVWSSRALPEVSTEINQTFRQLGLVEVEVEASAYGKDCLDSATNQVVDFVILQTDVYFQVSIENVNDPQLLGEWVERIAKVMIDKYKPGKIPGTTAGYYGFTFTNGVNMNELWSPREKVDNLIKESVKGRELFEALQSTLQ